MPEFLSQNQLVIELDQFDLSLWSKSEAFPKLFRDRNLSTFTYFHTSKYENAGLPSISQEPPTLLPVQDIGTSYDRGRALATFANELSIPRH